MEKANAIIAVLSIILMATVMCQVQAFADDNKAKGDDFISSTVSSVFDKLNQYSSGEKHIFYTEEELENEDFGYGGYATGQKVPRKTVKTGPAAPVDEPL
jgi:hypothetical protein